MKTSSFYRSKGGTSSGIHCQLSIPKSLGGTSLFVSIAFGLLLLPSSSAFCPLRRPFSPTQVPRYAEANSISAENSLSHSQRQQQQWITCSSSKELAYAVRKLVRPEDRVAELGSQLREVSSAICETGGNVVLVDTVRKFPKDSASNINNRQRTQAMRMKGEENNFFPESATFHEIERLDDWRHAFFPGSDPTSAYDVLVLDVNSIVGNDLEWTTLSLIREFLALNGDSCRLVLVKSLSLNQWASRLIHGQRWCRLGGFSQMEAKSEHLQKICQIVATVRVPEYRDTIPHTVRAGDAVLEIGCHLGTSTALINEAAAKQDPSSGNIGYCIGVDIGTKIIQGAHQRHPHLFFEVGDAWRTAALLRTQQVFLQQQAGEDDKGQISKRTGFDVVYVDVGGLSGQDGIIESLSLLSALSNAFEPRCIVIKSLCMRRLSSTLLPYWKLQKRS